MLAKSEALKRWLGRELWDFLVSLEARYPRCSKLPSNVEGEMLKSLGKTKKLRQQKIVWRSVPFSEVAECQTHRLDAEHYIPKHKKGEDKDTEGASFKKQR